MTTAEWIEKFEELEENTLADTLNNLYDYIS